MSGTVCHPDSTRLLFAEGVGCLSARRARHDTTTGTRSMPVHRDAETPTRVRRSACRCKHPAKMFPKDVSRAPTPKVANLRFPPRIAPVPRCLYDLHRIAIESSAAVSVSPIISLKLN